MNMNKDFIFDAFLIFSLVLCEIEEEINLNEYYTEQIKKCKMALAILVQLIKEIDLPV